MKITVARANERFSKPIEYTFQLILSILGIEYDFLPYSGLTVAGYRGGDLLISYGLERPDLDAHYQIHIYQSELFGTHYGKLSSMPQLPLRRWKALPVIYEGNGHLEDLVVRNGNVIETNIDIIASSFFMLSRYEEIVVDERDQYDRFPAEASIAYKERFLTRPIVNEYIDLLWEWVSSFPLGFKRSKFWTGADFAVLLTHDVDRIQRFGRHPPLRSIASSVKNKQIGTALRHVSDWTMSSLLKVKADPYWTFDWITELEHQHGVTSSFYFMTGGDTEYDSSYSISEPRICDLMKKLEAQGHEVGFHGSFNSYNDYEIFASEKAKLDRVVSNKRYGGRQHYLRWKTPESWRIWEKAGMLYDTTLGYPDHEGFRCGICLPFKPFDVLEDRVLDLWEMPLAMMDASFMNYRSLSLDEISEAIDRLIGSVVKHNGLLVTLWHSNYFSKFYPGIWGELYHQILRVVDSKTSSCQRILSEMQNMVLRNQNGKGLHEC